MTIWYLAKRLIKLHKIVKIEDYKKYLLVELSADLSIKYATHLVYMTNASRTDEMRKKCILSCKKKTKESGYILVCITNILLKYKTEYKDRDC
jgi:KUP system potassium uptake protein